MLLARTASRRHEPQIRVAFINGKWAFTVCSGPFQQHFMRPSYLHVIGLHGVFLHSSKNSCRVITVEYSLKSIVTNICIGITEGN